MMADRRALSKAAVKAVLDTIGKGLLRVEGRVTSDGFRILSRWRKRSLVVATTLPPGKTIEAPAP